MERENIGAYVKRLVRQSGVMGKLIAANTIVFLIFLVIGLVERLSGGGTVLLDNGSVIWGVEDTIKGYLVAPGNPAELIYKPWSLITQMFTHANFGHFFFNMIVLYFSGRIFTQFFGQRRLLLTYFLGGIFAYVFHVVAYYSLPALMAQGAPNILGASASIMAIFVASAVYQPSYIVHFFGVLRVPLFLLAAIYVVGDLLGVGTNDKIAHFAHLGGALFGGLSVINAHSPRNFMNRFDKFIFKFKRDNFSFKRKPKMKVYGSSSKAKEMTDDEYNANKSAQKDRIDAILDKISKKGYEGLTKEEKDILFNESKRG